ncbi:hypothetical protein CN063_27655 [Sinorhizobium meliloti]|nr:hypothetical protein CN063_27655 [Sinorhizobium meliloti]
MASGSSTDETGPPHRIPDSPSSFLGSRQALVAITDATRCSGMPSLSDHVDFGRREALPQPCRRWAAGALLVPDQL